MFNNTTVSFPPGAGNVSSGICEQEAALHTNSDEDVYDKYDIAEIITITVLSVIGVIGNCLVLVVATRGKIMKTTNNTMISFLAISDLVFLLLIGPSMAIEHIAPRYPFGNTYCKTSNFVMYTCVYVSIYFLCLMSVDRFCAIIFPFKSIHLRTKRNLHISCAAVLVCACVINIQAIFVHTTTELAMGDKCLVKCAMVDNSDTLFPSFTRVRAFVGVFLLLGYVFPLIVISVMYTCIFIKLCRRNQTKLSETGSTGNKHTRGALIALALEGSFFVCWTPLQVFGFLVNFTKVLNQAKSDDMFMTHLVCSMLVFLSNCLNPVLYTFLSKEYRENLISVLKIRKVKEHHRQSRLKASKAPPQSSNSLKLDST